jgi:acylphosphatase
MVKHVSIKITGRVQGVFFRASAKEQADTLGVKGFVRNEPDGSVYVEAESDEMTLTMFLTWCRKGPPLAQVDRVHVLPGEWQGFKHFVINRE